MSTKTKALLAALTIAYLCIGCASLGRINLCATGEVFDGDECVCKPFHEPDADGKGCHAIPPPPEPTPAPKPTPNPSPATPEPPPLPPIACKLPSRPECGAPGPEAGPWGCCSREGREDNYLEAVEEAIAFTRTDKPSLFDGNRIVNTDAYRMAVVTYLRLHGYCAALGGPEDEIAVKQTNDFSEQYDIIIGDNQIGAFQAVVCKPARF